MDINMKNTTKQKNKKVITSKADIQSLSNSRDGGQIALRGYSYQFLYSCYLILSSSSLDISFQLEGIEDIDCIKQQNGSSDITHIQLKYSVNKQDASFLIDVLTNFLEVYLLDQNRFFKLVYDFPVAKGNLSKLFAFDLDSKSRIYWAGVISNIKKNNPSWDWSVYDFDKFISHLSFENIKKSTLAAEIEKSLIGIYEISTDNVSLFVNSIKILCFEKMEQRAYVTKSELDSRIQSVKIDISKGPQNPAHSWIRKLDYSKPGFDEDRSFYEGKKATPADIASGLPIKRPGLEKDVVNSICENTVTVIKASSGQGKTTLALRVAYLLQNEYTPYQLLVCDEIKEIGNIVQYFKARIQFGEKILILIDNLDNHLSKCNDLIQLLQSELHGHYKVLITSREIDWYNYSGDLSNIQSLKIIKPTLEEKEAIEIFNLFRKANQLHPSMTSWQKAWNKIAERQLLIEYVYLLTHGEMLSERIAAQISEIGQSSSGKAKCEILRKVCFADICGVRISIANLYSSQSEDSGADFGELLKSMESEFLVHVNAESGYIEGLHPIRSKHVVDRLHEFLPIDNTAISVIKIAKKTDLPVLFSHLPEFDLNKSEFFTNVVEILWDKNDLSNYISAIQGLFSGSVMQYYLSNQLVFDDANSHGGLFIISTELCPFTTFAEFGVSIDTLDKMREILPDNKNIEYLCELRDRIPVCDLPKTFVYAFCKCLYRKLFSVSVTEIKDIESYASISEWIYNINSGFNLSANISLDYIWSEPEKLTLECMSTLMYLSYCGNKDMYMAFARRKVKHILTYLKQKTKSCKLFINSEKNAIHVEYILRLRDIKTANEQSVLRLKYICRTLPIFDVYCADALKPTLSLLATYTTPDDAHKEMPIKNIAIMFHQNLASLWNKTIMSNYEFDTATEWLDHWFDVREHICLLADKYCACIYKLLGGKPLGSLAGEADRIREEFTRLVTGENRYPKGDRPFEEKATVPEGLGEIQKKYFQSMQNFMNQFPGLLAKEKQETRLAMVNLMTAQSALTTMQNYFAEIAMDFDFKERKTAIDDAEVQNIGELRMACSYYQTHSPNKHFNKYQIKNWYEVHCREERTIVEDELSELEYKYPVHFPNQIYSVDMLTYYPIIIDNFNMASESNSAECLLDCIAFANAPFDYLVMLFTNEPGKITPFALQFSRQMFVDLKEAIELDNVSLIDKRMLPVPVEVTEQMLGCFSEKYDLPEKNTVDVDELPVGDVAEELWAYSKLIEVLTEPEDASYLATEIQGIRIDVMEKLYLLKDKLSAKDVDWLTEICRRVFSGGKFDDIMFNDVIGHFLQ